MNSKGKKVPQENMIKIYKNKWISIHTWRGHFINPVNTNLEMWAMDNLKMATIVVKKLQTTELRFLQKTLQISWMTKKSRNRLWEADTKRSLINCRISEHTATFLAMWWWDKRWNILWQPDDQRRGEHSRGNQQEITRWQVVDEGERERQNDFILMLLAISGMTWYNIIESS